MQGNHKTNALKKALKQLVSILPILMGVIMLLGLFKTFVSRNILFSVFSGKIFSDTLLGACFGSILAGHPVNSYIIGGLLLKMGVSLFAVTAFLLTWVTVGLIQLPLEITVLGRRFAILRNSISFILSIPIALLTVLLLRCLS